MGNSRKKQIIYLVILTFLASCSQNKYIFKSNTINTVRVSPRPPVESSESKAPDTLIRFKPSKGFWSEIKEKEDHVIFTPVDPTLLTSNRQDEIKVLLISPESERRQVAFQTRIEELKGRFFSPDVMLDSFKDNRLKYFDIKPVLQTLSTPVKIRPRIKDQAYKDSFPSQVSTGVNLGIALGIRFSINHYQSKPNSFGFKGNRISFIPGIFYGVGAASLTKANTRKPVITFERSALVHTMGGFAMFGFNSLNIGYSFGYDFSTGTGSKSWVYQGKLWHGVAFSINLIN